VNFKLHKLAGLLIGFWLFNLSLSGFFLNHEKNNFDMNFLWSISLPTSLFNEYSLKKHQYREVNGYKIHPSKGWKAIPTMRGLFINKGDGYKKIFDGRIFKIEPKRDENFNENFDTLYLATDKGIVEIDWNGNYKTIALKGKTVTSISVYGDKILAVEKKKEIYLIDRNIVRKINLPDKVEIPDNVKFSRFVRDFHYGRGLIVNPASAYINDFTSLWWIWLSISGYVIFLMYKFLKRKIISGYYLRKLIKFHGNIVSLALIPLIFLLALTGLFIDHPKFFREFISFNLPTSIMPPIYHSPHTDIWGIDFDGKTVRIGTRYGVYKVEKDKLTLENKGFAYKMIRVGDILYISGMGSPNRYLKNDNWFVIKSHIHMPVDFIKIGSEIKPVSKKDIDLKLSSIPLYTFFLTLHDGSFFHRHFIYLNDISVILTFLLLYTGFGRYLKRKRW